MDFWTLFNEVRPAHWTPNVPLWVSAGGLSIGFVLGTLGFFFPKLTSHMTDLQANPARKGGFAEFRAVYGGLYVVSHGVALLFMSSWALGWGYIGKAPLDWTSMGAVAICGSMWFGTALGRLLSMLLDKTDTGLNQLAVAVDILIGVAIIYPWVHQAIVFVAHKA